MIRNLVLLSKDSKFLFLEDEVFKPFIKNVFRIFLDLFLLVVNPLHPTTEVLGKLVSDFQRMGSSKPILYQYFSGTFVLHV